MMDKKKTENDAPQIIVMAIAHLQLLLTKNATCCIFATTEESCNVNAAKRQKVRAKQNR